MSDDLTPFRDHCARMAKAEHKLECKVWARPGGSRWPEWIHPDPYCPGCVTDADRALWQRLAREVDDYLAPTTEEGLFA